MYIPTFTGKRLNCLDPQGAEIDLVDIARGLSRAGRFANQTVVFFSVAQHALLVEQIAGRMLPEPSREFLLAALLHRAHEAYLGPATGPLADTLNLLAPGVLGQVQRRLSFAVERRFGLQGLDVAEWELIKLAERDAEKCERDDLRHDPGGVWPGHEGLRRPAGVPLLRPMGADQAMVAYMTRFLELWGAL